eukprot:scaffold8471_cov184-Amphora_coffeaeformis.AAC.5
MVTNYGSRVIQQYNHDGRVRSQNGERDLIIIKGKQVDDDDDDHPTSSCQLGVCSCQRPWRNVRRDPRRTRTRNDEFTCVGSMYGTSGVVPYGTQTLSNVLWYGTIMKKKWTVIAFLRTTTLLWF